MSMDLHRDCWISHLPLQVNLFLESLNLLSSSSSYLTLFDFFRPALTSFIPSSISLLELGVLETDSIYEATRRGDVFIFLLRNLLRIIIAITRLSYFKVYFLFLICPTMSYNFISFSFILLFLTIYFYTKIHDFMILWFHFFCFQISLFFIYINIIG